MSVDTFSGSHLSFAAAEPATFDQAGYEALTWTQDDCSSTNIPAISKTSNSVEVATVCNSQVKDIKGTYKFDALSFTMLSDWDNTAQIILESALDSQDVISVRIEFATGDIAYFTVQVAMFSITDGGSGDDLNQRSVEMWIQSTAITKVNAV